MLLLMDTFCLSDNCAIILSCVEPVELSYRQIYILANAGIGQCGVDNKGAICADAGLMESEYFQIAALTLAQRSCNVFLITGFTTHLKIALAFARPPFDNLVDAERILLAFNAVSSCSQSYYPA